MGRGSRGEGSDDSLGIKGSGFSRCTSSLDFARVTVLSGSHGSPSAKGEGWEGKEWSRRPLHRGSRSPCIPQIMGQISRVCWVLPRAREWLVLVSYPKTSLPNCVNHLHGSFMIFSNPKTLWFLHGRGAWKLILKLFSGSRGSPSLSLLTEQNSVWSL